MRRKHRAALHYGHTGRLSQMEKSVTMRLDTLLHRYRVLLDREAISKKSQTYARKVTRRRVCSTWILRTFSFISLLNALSLAALQTWWMSLLSVLLALLLANLSCAQPFRYLGKFAIIACVCAMIAASPITLNQLTSGIRNIGDHALKSGVESVTYVNRFGLWWSAVWLSIGGVFYGAPYAAAEQLLMFWPGEKERLWNDDFPNKTEKVRSLIKTAKDRAKGKYSSYKYDLLWKSYCQDHCDVGLALNGGDLTVDISDLGQHCVATARVSVSYKPQYRASTILGYGEYRLRIDQAAYWSIQELGWLFPYTLRY